MRLQVDDDVEVARRAAVTPRFAFAGQADAIVLVDARRNLHRQRLVLLDAAGAVARRARDRGSSCPCRGTSGTSAGSRRSPATTRTSPRPWQVVHVLGLGAGLGARALARLAFLQRRNADLDLGRRAQRPRASARGCSAGRRRGRRRCRGPPRPCWPKISPKMSPNASAKPPKPSAPPGRPPPNPGRPVDTRMSELVVGRALARVREDFVGLLGFLEFLLGALVVRIAVRMMFHRELAIGLLDVLLGSVAAQAEDRVVVAFRHASCPLIAQDRRSDTGTNRQFPSTTKAGLSVAGRRPLQSGQIFRRARPSRPRDLCARRNIVTSGP